MSTTNLFVELIVIGVGTFAWLGLLLSWFIGLRIEAIHQFDWKAWEAVPALALVYLLGIVTDRVADNLSERVWTKGRKYHDGEEKYFKDRAYVLNHSDRFADQYQYSRSRQRICRGWAINAIALTVAFNLFAIGNETITVSMRIAVSFFFIAIAVLCVWSWSVMVKAELVRIKEEAEALRTEGKSSAAKASR